MRPECNSQIGMSRWILLLSIVVFAILLTVAVRHWAPARVIKRQQASLIDAIERRSSKRLERLLSPSYQDQWNFDQKEAALALSDIGSQFFSLVLTPSDSSVVFPESDVAVVTVRLEVSGQGSPIAHEIIRTANRLKTPFTFRWRRQSFWPGDWKLIGIENPDLPTELYGYRPGDLRRLMEGDAP